MSEIVGAPEAVLRLELQARAGDFTVHDDRYPRTVGMEVLRRELTSGGLYFDGASAPAVPTGARHADVSMLWGGSARLREQAREREVHDERLWFGVASLTGASRNSSALVGTPEQVARALMRYREAGVDTVLIRGFDPLEDVVDWGRELIPRIRDLAQTIPVGGSGA